MIVRAGKPFLCSIEAYVFRMVCKMMCLHTGWMAHDSPFLLTQYPQFTPARSPRLFIMRSKCRSGFPFERGNRICPQAKRKC
jgi:hypothetical protein